MLVLHFYKEIDNFQDKFAEEKMSKRSEDASVTNHKDEETQFEPYQQVSRLCLFFEAENIDDYQKILSFVSVVKGEIRKVDTLAFYRGKLPESLSDTESIRFVGKKDFNLFKQKSASLREWLKAHDFDMLISFAQENMGNSERIIKDVKAKIKVGPNFSKSEQYFDISIGKQGGKVEFEEFYKQVKHYFSQLNIELNV